MGIHTGRKHMNSNYKNARKTVCAASYCKKWLFHSKDAAIEAANFYFNHDGWRRKEKGLRARPYYCEACGGWHLTKMGYKEWNERKREIWWLRNER